MVEISELKVGGGGFRVVWFEEFDVVYVMFRAGAEDL